MKNRDFRLTLLIFATAVLAAMAAAVIVFGGFLPPYYEKRFDASAFAPPELVYRPADYAELAGWMQDDLQPAFAAYLKSCAVLAERHPDAPANPHENLGDALRGATLGGAAADWLAPCRAAAEINAQKDADPAGLGSALRGFFETHFQPIEILARRSPLPGGPARRLRPRIDAEGTFTGYFEPVYAAARQATPTFSAPVYRRPTDLIDVDLGVFRDEWAGERIAGRLEEDRLVPYPDRQSIDEGALTDIAEPIAWMEPNDLLFLQIQGSGRLRFESGGALRVGYAGQNGHPYTAIGRVMVERGVAPPEEISMQTIRAWLASATPEAARELRQQNASYVFFQTLDALDDDLGPLGAQGASLTPERSLAVDRRYHTLGAPVWVDIDPVEALGPEPIRRLMIAQDTGGAIRGPVRGDVYWGTGAAAGEIAGPMNVRGRFYVFLPRPLAARLP